MARSSSDMLTEREAQIMGVLWDVGEATSDAIGESLPGDPHDSTVRTLLRVMKDKGYVRTVPKTRPIRYRAVVPKANAQRKAAKSLLSQFFGGSAEGLVLRLLEDEQLTPEQLERLKESHVRRRRKRGKK